MVLLKVRAAWYSSRSGWRYLQLLPIFTNFGPVPFQRICSKVSFFTPRISAAWAVLRFGVGPVGAAGAAGVWVVAVLLSARRGVGVLPCCLVLFFMVVPHLNGMEERCCSFKCNTTGCFLTKRLSGVS